MQLCADAVLLSSQFLQNSLLSFLTKVRFLKLAIEQFP